MKLRSIPALIIILFCCLTASVSKAQTSDPFGNSSTPTDPFGNGTQNNTQDNIVTNAPPPPPPDPIDTPIDGGLSVLIASGVLYGIKKWKGKKNEKPF